MKCFTLLVVCVATVASAEEELVEIHMFRRETAPETVYTVDADEIARLKRTNGWIHQGVLGRASSKSGEGLTKLHRAHRGRWHVFYTKAPEKLPPKTELEKFDVWVWENEAEGLVPVYGCSLPDWRDMIFSTDEAEIERAIEHTWKAQRVRRKNHGVMFYLKPVQTPPQNGSTSE